jgi:hypothetical protein
LAIYIADIIRPTAGKEQQVRRSPFSRLYQDDLAYKELATGTRLKSRGCPYLNGTRVEGAVVISLANEKISILR